MRLRIWNGLLVAALLAVGAAGCADDDGCGRVADLAQMCDPTLTDEEVEEGEALCDALIGDDNANACADCREGAADPCDSDAECDAACSL